MRVRFARGRWSRSGCGPGARLRRRRPIRAPSGSRYPARPRRSRSGCTRSWRVGCPIGSWSRSRSMPTADGSSCRRAGRPRARRPTGPAQADGMVAALARYGQSAARRSPRRRRAARAGCGGHAPGRDARAVRPGGRRRRAVRRQAREPRGSGTLERVRARREPVRGPLRISPFRAGGASLDHNDLTSVEHPGRPAAPSRCGSTTGATAWSRIRSRRCSCRSGSLDAARPGI